MSTQRFLLTGLLILALLAPGTSASLAQPAAPLAAAASSTASGSMLIIENAGQWPEAARFQVWGSPLGAGTTWLAEDAIWLVVGGGERETGSMGDEETFSPSPSRPLPPSPQTAIKLTFPGSNPDVRIEPFDPLTTTVSYFIGNDPDQWHPTVPVWGGVRYVDLYPGVNLVVGGQDPSWRLEAMPGAAVEQVRVQAEGADSVALDGATLRLAAQGEPLELVLPQACFAYDVAGVTTQGDAYSIDMSPIVTVSRQPAAPDDDPGGLLYSTFLGGTGEDYVHSLELDATGRATVAGYTESSDFPTTAGAFDPNYNGSGDVFVARLNAAGTALDYATFLGGGDYDDGADLALDADGRATVTGATESGDFPITPTAFDPSYNGGYDIFLVRLNATGSALEYATFLGGSAGDEGWVVALDTAGRATVVGRTYSGDFPITPGAFDPSFNGGEYGDGFVARLNAAGNALDYATFLGGSGSDYIEDLALDDTSAVVTGGTSSSDFPTTPGAFDPSFNDGYWDGFVVRLNPTGSALDYATFLGGSGWDHSLAIALDNAGRATVAGSTGSSDFPTTPGAFEPTCSGDTCSDAYLVQLNSAGSALEYATFLGGSDIDNGYAVALDAAGRAIVAGDTESSDFPTTPGAVDPSHNGYSDAFLVRFNSNASAVEYSTYLGGSDFESARALAIDEVDRATVTGDTWSADFPTTPDAFDPTHNGGGDVFLTKLDVEEPTSVTLTGLQADAVSNRTIARWLVLAVLALTVTAASLLRRQSGKPSADRTHKTV